MMAAYFARGLRMANTAASDCVWRVFGGNWRRWRLARLGAGGDLWKCRQSARVLLLLILPAVVVAACSRAPPAGEELVIAGVDLPDLELRAYLAEVIESNRAMSAAAAMRGRLAMAYDVNGLPDAALATYAQAAALDGDDFRWPYFSARLLADAGRFEEALAALDNALAIDPDYPPAWLWRGSWLLETGRPDAALSAFEAAGKRGTGSEADFGRALALLAQEKAAEALPLLAGFAKETGHPYAHRAHGRALLALGRENDARVALARGRSPVPFQWGDPRAAERLAHVRGYASFARAQTLSSEGKTRQALAVFERLRALYPAQRCGAREDFFFACNLLNSTSIAHGRAGRVEQGVELARRGIAIRPDFAPFHLAIADHYRQLRDLPAALRHIDRAIALNPANGHAHAQRGRYLFGLDMLAGAKEALETALRLAPGERTTLFYLGLVEAKQERWGQAAERFERVVALDPDFALGHLYRARSLAEGGHLDVAHEALTIASERGADPREVRATERRLRELEADA